MKDKLVYYGGNGFGECDETGVFTVCFSKETKEFNRLNEAKKFYDSLDEEKAFWDLTRIPELIDAMVIDSGKETEDLPFS